MPDWSPVTRSHVLAAIAECDRVGSRDFLSRYRVARAQAHTLWHGGQEYDSTTILGVAYLHATGRVVSREELRGGETGVARVLEGLGFDVVADPEALEQLERHEAEQAARDRARGPAGDGAGSAGARGAGASGTAGSQAAGSRSGTRSTRSTVGSGSSRSTAGAGTSRGAAGSGTRTAGAKSAGTRSTRTKPAEREPQICPTCFMALPATGICDNCD